MREITDEKLEKYFNITKEALDKAKAAEKTDKRADDVLDMAERYYNDAKHFKEQGNIVNAFAALNYAHGWLDSGARAGFYKVNDSRLFTVDDVSN
ncbi:DUF357 domain-containing protein [Nanoarchaeota archaeon]